MTRPRNTLMDFPIEIKSTAVIFLTLISTIILNLLDNKRILKLKKLSSLKKPLIEFNIFIIASILYCKILIDQFNQSIFLYYYNDMTLYYPIIILSYIFLILIGYNTESNDNQKGNQFFLKMLLKAFFIPFIYGSLSYTTSKLILLESFSNRFEYYFYLFILTFDVLIALFGYIFSSKLFNNKIISINTDWRAWLVCLFCYPPFLYFYTLLLAQVDNKTWHDWAQNTWYYYPWLLLITITWGFYGLSHAFLGPKLSNLSWRGLVNNGLYRYTKHPAYISKNLYWWLHTIPFFGVVGIDIFKNLLAMCGVSLIYYLRAKTEEKHLLKFKEYQEYYTWIENNGLWAKIKKKLKKS